MIRYDISPTLCAETAVFPGDTPFQRAVAFDMKAGDSLTLSSIKTTLHLGAHADAPNHYHPDGSDIANRSLDYYYGPCQVIDVPKKSAPYRLTPDDLKGQTIRQPRVLLRTLSFENPNHWTDTFTALSPELVNWFAEQAVCLIGIDTPSVDPAEAKQLIAHEAIYQHDMAILEGIVLNDVPCGDYTLVALPLKIAGGDAAPVRAVLLDL